MISNIRADRRLVRAAGGSVRYVVATIEAPRRAGDRPRLPLNVAVVIDRSGSMAGEKLVQAREAAQYAVQQLQPQDRFAVVAYDEQVDLLAPSRLATAEACESASRGISGLGPGGCTDLAAGWLNGCREIAEHLDQEQIARCLLMTDGLANSGITDHAELCRHATELRARGIMTSTFGIGADFDEVLLSAMAEAGGGKFRLVRTAEEIPALIREELHEGLEVVAADTVLEVTAPPGVVISSLNDFPVVADETGTARIRLGDLVSGQIIEPIVQLHFGAGPIDGTVPIRFRLRDRLGALDDREVGVEFQYADSDATSRQSRDRIVDRRAAAIHAASAKRRALAFNRHGDFRSAERAIEDCLRHLTDYAGDDRELQAIIADLQLAKSRYVRDMDMLARKREHVTSVSFVKDLKGQGSARRSGFDRSLVVVPFSPASARAAHRAAQAVQGPGMPLFGRIRVVDGPPDWMSRVHAGPVLTPVEENRLVDAANDLWPEPGVRVVITGAQLADNWFSHWVAAGRTAVVSLHRFEGIVSLELAAYLAYEILLNGLNNAAPSYDPAQLEHRETRGCLFDFCGDRRDMEITLQSMHLCADCRRGLEALGIDTEAVDRLTDVIRDMARPRSRRDDPRHAGQEYLGFDKRMRP